MSGVNNYRSESHRKMKRLILLAAAAATLSAPVFAAVADPTPDQIASNWAVMGGGKDGMVVYNTGKEMWLMTLKTGATKKLMNYPQASFSFSSAWGQSSGYKISPDGHRIAAQNGTGVMVCNIDGTSPHVIWSGIPTGDQIALSWDGNDKVVYSSCQAGKKPYTISSTQVKEDNSPGPTDTLWNTAKDPAPAGASYGGASGLVSVNKNGDYLSFDIMTDGPNIPVIVQVSTKKAHNPTHGGDGCQIRMWPDGSGTVSYHVDTHLADATVYNYGQDKTIAKIPQPTSAMGACGNGGFNWAFDTNYLISTGDNDAKKSPGCISTARIRNAKSWDKYMILGATVYWPDLWVGTATSVVPGKADLQATWNGAVRFAGNLLSIKDLGDKEIRNARVMNLKGAIVASGEKISRSELNVNVSSLPVGVYLLSWERDGVTMSRHVNVLSGNSAGLQVVVSR
jgi:hypothetical protein